MFCKSCGSEILNPLAHYCPICGLAVDRASADAQQQQPTNYGHYPEQGFGDLPPYQQGYTQSSESPLSQMQPRNLSQEGYYMPPVVPTYQASFNPYAGAIPASAVHTFTVSTNTASTKNEGTLLIEIILSLFGVFGVGWLMAKETAIGIILLIASIFIYWPLIILGTIFTFGLGLICLGPLSIAAIILNAILLHKVLMRKATHFPPIVQSPQMHVPPQR